MSRWERQLLQALLDLESGVAELRLGGARPDLRKLLDRVDELEREAPADLAGDLRHYLQRKSYEKARLYLEERWAEIGAGNCGRGGSRLAGSEKGTE